MNVVIVGGLCPRIGYFATIDLQDSSPRSPQLTLYQSEWDRPGTDVQDVARRRQGAECPLALFQRLRGRDGEAFGEICRRLWASCSLRRDIVCAQPELGPVYDEEDALASTLSLMWIQFMEGRTVPPDGVDEFLRLAPPSSADESRRKAASCGPPSDPHRPTKTPTVDPDSGTLHAR